MLNPWPGVAGPSTTGPKTPTAPRVVCCALPATSQQAHGGEQPTGSPVGRGKPARSLSQENWVWLWTATGGHHVCDPPLRFVPLRCQADPWEAAGSAFLLIACELWESRGTNLDNFPNQGISYPLSLRLLSGHLLTRPVTQPVGDRDGNRMTQGTSCPHCC